ncbi:phosphoenolpyruvate--protein phosphotransferase [Pseudomonas sp. SIMBA_077]
MVTSQQLELLAPLSGVLIALEQVPDPVFSSRLMGDGLCIDPTSEVLCAPLAGVISNLQKTGHALSITSANGVQVLLHIGLDTVNLGGKGFTALVEEGQQVAAGQALIEFDADAIAQQARSLLTLMLVVSGERFTLWSGIHGLVDCGQPLLRLDAEQPQAVMQEAVPQGEALFSQSIALPNRNGLHARPATVFAQAAKGFIATIELHKQARKANAKSLVAILSLQTTHADRLQISATGVDAEQAIGVLSELLLTGCGEALTPLDQPALTSIGASVAALTPVDGTLLHGVCASFGAVFGHVVQIAQPPLDYPQAGAGEALEIAQLQSALLAADKALDTLGRAFSQGPQARIFSAHRELLHDPSLLDYASTLMAAGKSAAYAWAHAIEANEYLFRNSGNAFLAERAQDLADVGQRVLKLILRVEDAIQTLPDNAILIAEQLSPSQTAELDTSKVVGFATVGGGATSHVAILAQALGLPALCGLPHHVLALANGTPVLLDAQQGVLQVRPSEAAVEGLTRQREQQRVRHAREVAHAAQPAQTRDGHQIEVSANIASLAEAERGMAMGADGVGLLRSEFLYLGRSHAPDHDEQVATYRAIARAVGAEYNLVVRTLDVGGDKPLPYVPMEPEANPFLGMRGIRLCLQRPELLREQFSTILASHELTRLHIMLPMVTELSELRLARQLLEEQAQRLGIQRLPKLGIMIEVPAAALMADVFAPEVDFFSIGTNDLTQYTLAMDRDHPRLASQADSFHPAVLRLIATTVNAAHAHGKWVGVCGALASESLAVPVLVGLGVDELSVSVPLIATIKAQVRELAFSTCQTLAQQVLALDSAAQVRAALQSSQLAYSWVLEN